MKKVKQIAYRFLTDAEFFNMYKSPHAEQGGGGQKYIDFPTGSISPEKWEDFFDGVEHLKIGTATAGPQWTFPIHSIGTADEQKEPLTIFQRRNSSISVSRQHIHSRGENRVLAWHPDYGFPKNDEYPEPMPDRQTVPQGLGVFLARTYENEIWAGWFMNTATGTGIAQDDSSNRILAEMLDKENEEGDSGLISFEEGFLMMDETNSASPFTSSQEAKAAITARTPRQRTYSKKQKTEAEIVDSLFAEDQEIDNAAPLEDKMIVVKVRRRNKKATETLKELYEHTCQITGTKFLFKKKGGTYYTEAHHLVPLGRQGADSPTNMIIIDPRIHRMLHYAEVEGIDLSKIQMQKDGSAILNIQINGEPYTITWHPKHVEFIKRFEEA